MNLTTQQKNNINILIDRMNKKGITSKYAQAAVLAIVKKESNFIPQNENLNYSASRLVQIFPSRFPNLTTASIFANKPEAIANKVYGGRFGNGLNEGFKYRGRGYNQITFKDTYKSIGNKIGVDLVSNPDLLNTPIVAADAAIVYFLDRIKRLYPTLDVNKVTDLTQILNVFYNANAGAVNKHLKDVTGGYAKAKSVVNDIYKAIDNNKGTTGAGLFFLTLTIIAIAKRKKIKEILTK